MLAGTREGSHWLVMSLIVYASRYPRGFPLVGNDIKMKRLPESDSFGRPSRGAGLDVIVQWVEGSGHGQGHGRFPLHLVFLEPTSLTAFPGHSDSCQLVQVVVQDGVSVVDS